MTETSRFAKQSELAGDTPYQGLRAAVLSGIALDQAFALRYRAYRHTGALAANSANTFIDAYDLSRTSAIIGIVDQHATLAGCVRFSVQPPTSAGVFDFKSSPEFVVFPDAIEELSRDDRPIASGARLSIEPKHPRRREIAVLLMIALVTAAHAVGAKWAIATVRGSHLAFYRRLMLMEAMTEPRSMPYLIPKYCLLASDIDKNYGTAMERAPEAARMHFERTNRNWKLSVLAHLPDVCMTGAA